MIGTRYVRRFVAFWIFLLALGSLVQSASAATPDEAAELEAELNAPVVVDGVVLFRVRGIAAYPAENRAQRIAEKVVELAADPTFDPAEIRVEQEGSVSRVMGRDTVIATIIEADARLAGIDREAFARAVAGRARETIEAWRADRSPARLQRGVLLTVAATAALAFVLWLGYRVFGWLRRWNQARFQAHIHDVAIGGFRIVRARQLGALVDGVQAVLWILFLLAALYVYFSNVLALFPWTRRFAGGLAALVLDPLGVLVGGFLDAVPNLIFLGVLFVVVRYVLKLVRLYFQGLGDGTLVLRDFDAEWALPTYRLVRIALVAFALVIAYPYVPGSGSEAFKGISIFLGIIFSLGSSTIIGNMIAGYSLTYRRVFKPGDRVRIGEHLGDVDETRILVTYLRTPKNEVVAIPNSAIVDGEVINYSSLAKTDGLILHTTVGIGYETPWRQVEAMLLEAAARTPGLLKEPRPFVLQKLLGDFCVTYEINGYTLDEHRMGLVYSDLHRHILDVFNEYGVQIMTPAYEGDPTAPKLVPRDQWYAAPAQPPAA
jgi:small-conductance mechanosensitive channel